MKDVRVFYTLKWFYFQASYTKLFIFKPFLIQDSMMFQFKTKLAGFCSYLKQGHAKICHFDDTDSRSKYSEDDIIKTLEFLVDYIFGHIVLYKL